MWMHDALFIFYQKGDPACLKKRLLLKQKIETHTVLEPARLLPTNYYNTKAMGL